MKSFVALLAVAVAALSAFRTSEGATRRPAPFSPHSDTLVVRVLDVGQGDATLITDGASRVLIDGGPDQARMDALLDSLGLDGQTIDVVILTHQHADHLVGLRALFETRHHIGIRYFFENGDAYSAANLRHLRDSIGMRVARHELVYRDTDDPCANGQPICTITLEGGAKLHVMRPDPAGRNPNDRSVAVKLVSADSGFTMWLAGDAEQDAIGWFLNEARYERDPGMHVDVLKANHHGSCNGVTSAYLEALRPSVVVASVGAVNTYGHMHEQAKAIYTSHHVPWYRTDENGTIEIRAPGANGSRYSIRARNLQTDLSGPSDRVSTQPQCNPIP